MKFSKKALREFVNSTVTGTKPTTSMASTGDTMEADPVNVTDVVDNNRLETDPNADHKPRSKAELKSAVGSLIDDMPTDEMDATYQKISNALGDDSAEQAKKDKQMKDRTVEETLRMKIRAVLEAIADNESVHAGANKDEEVLGGISKMMVDDIAARTREEVMGGNLQFKDTTGTSISGVKQYIDRLGFKIQYLREMDKIPYEDTTELQAFLEEMVESYIDLLYSSSALTKEELNELQKNPGIVSDSPNFRRFLGGEIEKLGTDEGWEDCSMPAFKEWVEQKYKAQTTQNQHDREAKKRRKADRPDT